MQETTKTQLNINKFALDKGQQIMHHVITNYFYLLNPKTILRRKT